jgi:polyisoprenoid-binding protein YceI
MIRILLLILFSLPALAQTPAVFNDFSPTVKGVTIGSSHCYLWVNLVGIWNAEVACYQVDKNGYPTVQQVQAELVGQTLRGEFDNIDGQFWWTVLPNGDGTTFWMMAALPTGCGAFDIPCGQSEVIQEGAI